MDSTDSPGSIQNSLNSSVNMLTLESLTSSLSLWRVWITSHIAFTLLWCEIEYNTFTLKAKINMFLTFKSYEAFLVLSSVQSFRCLTISSSLSYLEKRIRSHETHHTLAEWLKSINRTLFIPKIGKGKISIKHLNERQWYGGRNQIGLGSHLRKGNVLKPLTSVVLNQYLLVSYMH